MKQEILTILSDLKNRSGFKNTRPRTGISWHLVSLIVGVPIALCIYITLTNTERVAAIGLENMFLLEFMRTCVQWWTACAATYALSILIKPRMLPLWLITASGLLLAEILLIPYFIWLYHLFEPLMGIEAGRAALFYRDGPQPWGYFLSQVSLFGLVWVTTNYIFANFLGTSPFAPIPEKADLSEIDTNHGIETAPDSLTTTTPVFLKRLSTPILPHELITIKAEQHYIRLFWESGSDLVLYRLADAVEELGPALGLQVHRSYWVNKNKIKSARVEGKKMTLTMDNESKVPVSIPYQKLVRQTLGQNLIAG